MATWPLAGRPGRPSGVTWRAPTAERQPHGTATACSAPATAATATALDVEAFVQAETSLTRRAVRAMRAAITAGCADLAVVAAVGMAAIDDHIYSVEDAHAREAWALFIADDLLESVAGAAWDARGEGEEVDVGSGQSEASQQPAPPSGRGQRGGGSATAGGTEANAAEPIGGCDGVGVAGAEAHSTAQREPGRVQATQRCEEEEAHQLA